MPSIPTRIVLCILHFGVCLTAIAATPVPSAPDIDATGYLLLDHHSGRVIASKSADEPLEPASLTKLMTSYTVFQALRDGQITLNDTITVSERVWRTTGSRMFIEAGSQVSVDDLLQGMIVQSGNDASVALAEHVAGSEATFAELMNQYAQRLGLANSSFRNATGLPADQHRTTARDVATLARAIIAHFPEYYGWYSQREFTYNGITQHNRNSLLWRDESVDGMKTGHTEAAGYCLVSAAQRGEMRLIAVVMGTPNARVRAEASQALLNYGFRFYETHKLYSAGDEITAARVWKGDNQEAQLGLNTDLYITIPRGRYDQLSAEMDLADMLIAPVDATTSVGEVRVSLDDQLVARADLHALTPIASGSLWQRMRDSVLLWLE